MVRGVCGKDSNCCGLEFLLSSRVEGTVLNIVAPPILCAAGGSDDVTLLFVTSLPLSNGVVRFVRLRILSFAQGATCRLLSSDFSRDDSINRGPVKHYILYTGEPISPSMIGVYACYYQVMINEI